VEFLAEELGLEVVGRLPSKIRCGELRSAVRQMFGPVLPELAELSIKTSMKLEHGHCDSCKEGLEEFLDSWKTQRFRPVEVNPHHLDEFKKVFRSNLPEFWNKRKYPYIPNGHATLYNKRREGGNWNDESFSAACKATAVISSGKPRVVTLYSSHNTAVLTPLHYSLYEGLRRKGWLLVGEPTPDRVASLNGRGDFVSVDYQAATDNIKTEYVRAAVEVMIEEGKGTLSEDEVRCLKVLGELRLTKDGEICTRGQPMGSVMSFPLLCLINKTVHDLALTDLYLHGEVSFKEWTTHRCLINGDDQLTKEPACVHDKRNGGSKGGWDERVRGSWPPQNLSLFERISLHGSEVGLIINKEKTMQSRSKAEINSTLFEDCRLQKKVNCAALLMRPEVSDVLGFAAQSTRTEAGFRKIVRRNANILAKQGRKFLNEIDPALRTQCRRDSKIRAAIRSGPASERKTAPNLLPVENKPHGYNLSRAEEISSATAEVERLRRSVDFEGMYYAKKKLQRHRTEIVRDVRSWSQAVREKNQTQVEEKCLRIYARAWEEKQKRDLVSCGSPPGESTARFDALVELANHELGLDHPKRMSPIDVMVSFMRSRKTAGRTLSPTVREAMLVSGEVLLRWDESETVDHG
jgi:hypothetical protein